MICHVMFLVLLRTACNRHTNTHKKMERFEKQRYGDLWALADGVHERQGHTPHSLSFPHVAQTCLPAIPLIRNASDDAEAPVQNDVEVPGPFSLDGWNSKISLASPSMEVRAVEPALRPWQERFDLNGLQESRSALVHGVHEHEGVRKRAFTPSHCEPVGERGRRRGKRRREGYSAVGRERGVRDSLARCTIPRTGNALRHVRQIAHVHSPKALEDD